MKTKHFHVYIGRAPYHLVIPDEQNTFETQENLTAYGFSHVWDSAPSAFAGANYAAIYYGCPVPVDQSVL
jgi:hypothetical protein